MRLTEYPALGEQVWRETLPNGLRILVVPRPGISQKMVYFATDYGSIHTKFTLDGQAYAAPDGIAHYLEHKMFDMPERDVWQAFAALGASANAFTSYDMTVYLFSCTENFRENLALLLEFVSTPYFTAESVEKERGIIGQEIDMNLDSPDSRIYDNLVAAMYQTHPIAVPILGTRQTIAAITPELLYACHRAFYRPDTMLLCVVGDVAPETVSAIARQVLPDVPAAEVRRVRRWPEPMTSPKRLVEAEMDVAAAIFQLGFKCEYPAGEAAIRGEIVGDLAAEALFGESSELYLRLYEQGLINDAFGGGFETAEGMAMLTCYGESDDPQAVRDAILAQAARLAEQGLPAEDFSRMKRGAMGRRVRDLDSLEATCFRMCAYQFTGCDYFRFPAAYEAVTAEEVAAFLRRVVTLERSCLSVIRPMHGN